ncbi:MAG: hypothetical protein JSS51_03495 [Planctomycetes bacterium]|nr:hypothetical protein [Planctomycetota bacterium]
MAKKIDAADVLKALEEDALTGDVAPLLAALRATEGQTELTEDELLAMLTELAVPDVDQTPVGSMDAQAVAKELKKLPADPHKFIVDLNQVWIDLKAKADAETKKFARFILLARKARDEAVDKAAVLKNRISQLEARKAELGKK